MRHFKPSSPSLIEPTLQLSAKQQTQADYWTFLHDNKLSEPVGVTYHACDRFRERFHGIPSYRTKRHIRSLLRGCSLLFDDHRGQKWQDAENPTIGFVTKIIDEEYGPQLLVVTCYFMEGVQ